MIPVPLADYFLDTLRPPLSETSFREYKGGAIFEYHDVLITWTEATPLMYTVEYSLKHQCDRWEIGTWQDVNNLIKDLETAKKIAAMTFEQIRKFAKPKHICEDWCAHDEPYTGE